VMGPGHHPVVRRGQEPVEGIVSARIDIVDRLDLALTDPHEAPR
jgi:hypothetical protein